MATVGITDDGWKAHIVRAMWHDAYEVFVYRQENGGVRVLAADGMMSLVPDGGGWPKTPTFTLQGGHLQAIADALDGFGITPKQRRYENEMSLMKNHLEDMRSLVFKKDAIECPENSERK